MRSNLFDKSFLPEFSSRLKEKLRAWKEAEAKYKQKKPTNEDFANRVGLVAGTEIGRQSISRYLHEKVMPSRVHFEAMCKVLGCDESELLPANHSEQYKHSREYMKEVVHEKERFASDIGLQKSFIKWISDFPLYKTGFPLWLPMVQDNSLFAEKPITRMTPAPAVNLNSPYQTSYGGEIVTLSNNDLLFLKELQDAAAAFIVKRLEEKKKAYDEELQAENDKYKKPDEFGNMWYLFGSVEEGKEEK